MSYPEPRYFGDTGEVDFAFRPSDTAPDVTYKFGGTVDYLASSASTRGEFGSTAGTSAPTSPGRTRISTGRSPSRSSS